VLVVAADSEPRNLNPAIVASNGVFYVASKVIEPLAEMAYGGNGLVPRLATAWEGSPDGRSVRFTLREGVTWHDGKPFTSADVAFSALQVWKPLQNLGRVVFKDLEAVDTPDARTAILRFANPTPFQLIRNALPALTSVLPRHLYEGTDINANPANTKLVGTGPFRFVEHRPGSSTAWSAIPPIGSRTGRFSTGSCIRCCRTAAPSRRPSKRTRSSWPPSRPCRSPISNASVRCRA
jgi:peptide/nickel transport system substrate-binding protein